MSNQNHNNSPQAPQNSAEQQQLAGRKPDHAAYNIQTTSQGKAVWNRIGSAWQHRDGQGFEIDLHSVPVNGRVTVRELRDQAHKHYEQQAQTSQDKTQKQTHDQEQNLTHRHGRSR